MSGCEKYQELISAMLDGELSTEKTVELSVHLAKCPECRAMYEAFSAMREANEDIDMPIEEHLIVELYSR